MTKENKKFETFYARKSITCLRWTTTTSWSTSDTKNAEKTWRWNFGSSLPFTKEVSSTMFFSRHTKIAELKVENSAQTTSRFSPVSFRAPSLI